MALAFSLDSQVIAVLYNNSIGFWSTSKGAPIGFAQGILEKFTALAFGSNGLLVTGGENGGVAVWDWHDLAHPKLRTGAFDPITAVAFSPDNTLIVTAHRTDPPSLTVWEASRGKRLKALAGFSYAPTALQFTSDGAQLLTGGGGLGERTGDFWGDTPIYATGASSRDGICPVAPSKSRSASTMPHPVAPFPLTADSLPMWGDESTIRVAHQDLTRATNWSRAALQPQWKPIASCFWCLLRHCGWRVP